jgi:XTP/dITP diphosphohydrolase
MKLIFATGNAAKLREIRQIFDVPGVEILSMKEAGIDVDVEENGLTFEENALIKVRAIHKLVPDALIMADDSGLEVDALGKFPGVFSARWYDGHDGSYDVKNAQLIRLLSDFSGEERSARFVCAIAAVLPEGDELVVRAAMEGQIGYEIAGENGFGYDPIFFLPQYGKTSAEISPEEKNAISHRGKALRSMRDKLMAIKAFD